MTMTPEEREQLESMVGVMTGRMSAAANLNPGSDGGNLIPSFVANQIEGLELVRFSLDHRRAPSELRFFAASCEPAGGCIARGGAGGGVLELTAHAVRPG